MEELRSSEILDKEIEAECRKKAEQILESARENAKKITDGVTEKLENAKKEAELKSQKTVELYSKNINAALPLEKQRYLVSFIYKSILEEMNAYFENLNDSDQLKIISALIKKNGGALENKKINATVIGFKKSDAEKILKAQFKDNLSSVEEGKESLISEEAVDLFKFRKGIIVKTEDNSIICRFTLDEKIREVLDKSCNELSMALFGGRLPE